MDVKYIGARDLRPQLGHRIDAAYFTGEPTVITRNGEARAVIVSYAEWAAHHPDEAQQPPPPG